MTESLPAKASPDRIVEVSPGYLIAGFLGLACTLFAVSTGVLIVKDYTRYRRQKALLESATNLLQTFTLKGGEIVCNGKKTATSSQTKKSNKELSS